MPITADDIHRAAEELLLSGERPTIEKVRSRIGGSPNTILGPLKDWYQALPARLRPPHEQAARALPPAVIAAGQAMWEAAHTAAAQAFASRDERAADDLAEARRAQAQCEQALTQLQEDLQALRERALQAEQQRAEAQHALHERALELAAARAALDELRNAVGVMRRA